MDERLVAVRARLDTNSVSPASVRLLARVADDADRSGEVGALEQCFELAGTIAATTRGALKQGAEQVAAVCAQRLRDRRPLWWDE